MADMTFNCPHCQQPIQCDSQWAGQQIQCPLCQGALMVPQGASAPASAPAADYGKQVVTPPSGNKLAFQHNAQQPATQKRDVPIRNLVAPPPKKKSPLVGLAIGAAVVVALAGGGYFGWTKYQEKVEAKKAEEARQAEAAAKEAKKKEKAAKAAAAAEGVAAMLANAPKTPPAYTLDVATAKIPQCAVNGLIAGSNFVPDLVQVVAVNGVPVLRLTQGNPMQPDREILIYLGLKAGDKLSGHSWTIASEQKGADVLRVLKRWTVKPGSPTAAKFFTTGYAMQLQFGKLANGTLPGKIFIALPDQEQSVAGGIFQATTTLGDVIGAAPVAGGAPAPSVMPTAPAGDPRLNNRYR
jgi:hypothetical protein